MVHQKAWTGVVWAFVGVIILDLCELGGLNHKILVHNLEERKKIGEGGFLKFVIRSDSFPEKWTFVKNSLKFQFSLSP